MGDVVSWPHGPAVLAALRKDRALVQLALHQFDPGRHVVLLAEHGPGTVLSEVVLSGNHQFLKSVPIAGKTWDLCTFHHLVLAKRFLELARSQKAPTLEWVSCCAKFAERCVLPTAEGFTRLAVITQDSARVVPHRLDGENPTDETHEESA